jgi:hypothetical protein
MTLQNAFENLAVESKQDAAIVLLANIEAALGTLDINTDGLEALSTAANALLTSIDVNTAGLDALITAGNALLAAIDGNTDNIEALITATNAALSSIDTKTPALGQTTMAASQPVVIASDQSAVPVSGTVSTGGLTDTELRATPVPVSGPLTDAQLRAAPVPVSGTVTVTDGSGPLTVDGTVTVANPGLTDTELRATPVPVSGTVTAAEAKAEDTAAVSGDPGIPILGVRNDADAVRTSADGDYSAIAVDSAGRVKIAGTIATTGGLTDAQLRASAVPVVQNVDATSPAGMSAYRNINTQNVGVSIKGSAGKLYTITMINNQAADRFVKLYNIAGVPTAADTPIFTFGLSATDGFQMVTFEGGVAFPLGIGIRATTGVADGDNGAPGANQVIVNVGFR